MAHLIRQLNILLNKNRKWQLLGLFAVMLFGALLEAVGVSAIVPFVTIIVQDDYADRIPLLGNLYETWGNSDPSRFIVICMLILVGIFVFKALYLLMENRLQASFISGCKKETQDRLVRSFLRRPYVYFLDRNTSEIQKILVTDLRKVFQVLQQLLTMLTELVISIMLLITLFVIDPLMSACVLVIIAGAVLLIGRIIRPRLHRAGDVVLKHEKIRARWVSQGFAGIKEVKHLNAEDYIAGKVNESEKAICEGERVQHVMSSSPRVFIETVCICGMLAVMIAMVFMGRPLQTLLPAISAFAMVAIKLMPGANKITFAVAAVVYNTAAIDEVIGALGAEGDPEDGKLPTDSEMKADDRNGYDIMIKEVVYRYPGTDRKILDGLSLQIERGRMVGIMGTSGVGKTTLVDVMLGLLTPESGEVQVGRERIGYIPQNIFMLDDTVRANVAFGIPSKEIDENKVWSCLKEAQLYDYFQDQPDKLDTRVGERGVKLSGGQVQRIGIARALYRDPEILIFDEATSALDLETENAVLKEINEMHGKRTMVIVAHKSGALSDCDVVYKVDDGKLKLLSKKEDAGA